MILLDTNVLLYAFGGPHPLREPSKSILAAVGNSTIYAAIADVTLWEFVHATSRRESREATAIRTRHVVTAVSEVLAPDRDVRRTALTLLQDHERIQINDALIAATAITFQRPLVTADRAFTAIPGLRVLAPDSPDALDPDVR